MLERVRWTERQSKTVHGGSHCKRFEIEVVRHITIGLLRQAILEIFLRCEINFRSFGGRP